MKLHGEELLSNLINEPEEFASKGKGNDLLKAYFRGLPLDSIPELLNSKNRTIQREAVWIISELGTMGSSLIFDIIPFLDDSERAIRYEALESIMVFSEQENFGEFVRVVKSMESDDHIIRVRAMYLVSNATSTQLRAAIQLLSRSSESEHLHFDGLSYLLENDFADRSKILSMINSKDKVMRKYGAIAAKKVYTADSRPITDALTNPDADIKKFAQDVVDLER